MTEPINEGTQTAKILKYLLNGGKLTALDALKKFNCLRLGARIWNIKQMNKYKIAREWVTTKTSSKKVVRYSINL